jgi:HK97 family phage portal protein
VKLGPFELRFTGAKSGIANPSQWLMDWLGAGKSSTGIDVHETTAMQSVAVYACVKVLAETMAALPLIVYQRLPNGGKARATSHPLYRILHDAPNPEMSASDFRATMETHLNLWGNAYAEIERDVSGRPIALWPLRPDRMQIWRGFQDTNYQLEYLYSLYNGGSVTLAPSQVLHLKNLSIDGIRGLSPIAHLREAVGLALALESYAGHFFGNDSTPGGFLSHPGKLSETARENLKKGWEAGHRGLDQTNRMAVFEEGITFQKVGIPPEDAQFLGSRQFQLTEIARMFRVPQHLVGELGRVTHANIEHMGIDYVTHTIRPKAVNWEEAIMQKLFSESEQGSYFAEFLFADLLRGDLASRYAAYAVGKQWGWLNSNEIRDMENMNPISDEDGGNDYMAPLNMGPLQALAAPPVVDPAAEAGAAGSEDVPSERDVVWQRWFTEKIEAILRRERTDVLQNAQKLLRKGDLRGFQRWLSGFYAEDHPKWMEERLAPLFKGEPESFVAEYVSDFSLRHSQKSLQALQNAIASQNGHSLEALEGVFGTWESERSLEIVKSERWRLHLPSETRELAPATAYAPVINNYVTVPERQVTIDNHVEIPAAQIEVPVTNEINVAPANAPEVNVPVTVQAPPAANVTIETPPTTIQVQQPDVNIYPPAVTVNLPPEAPSQGVDVIYDANGKVTGTRPAQRKAKK